MERQPYRWRTLGLFEVHRARMWQTIICAGIVTAFVGMVAVIVWAA